MEVPEPTPSVPPANRTQLTAKGTPPSSSSSSSSLSSSVPLPRPLEALQEMGTPPFLVKTFEMVEDPATDAVVSWGGARNSFVVWDYCKLATDVLPRYFKHGNFCSFVRQLNTYGFKKVDPDRWEFANEGFLAGQKHLLKTIRRRRNPPKNPQQGVTNNPPRPVKSGLESEIQSLKTDKNTLMLEVAELRQHHQASLQELLSIEERLKGTEKRHHLMLGFLAKVVRSPSFVEKLVLQNEQKKALTSHRGDPMGSAGDGERLVPKKRRLPCSSSAENLQRAESEIETLLFRTPIQDVGADCTTEDPSWEGMLNQEEEAASTWGENVQDLVDQMGFLSPKQCKSI